MKRKRKQDKYSRAVAYLRKHPDQIGEAWVSIAVGTNHPAWCLFGLVARDPINQAGCGCLTQVHSGLCLAQTPSLTDAIRADASIPNRHDEITVASLPLFARWQRRIDRILKRGKYARKAVHP